jgi:hypothetical protein
VATGGSVVYTAALRNTGNVALSNIAVTFTVNTDSVEASCFGFPTGLAAGSSITKTCSYNVPGANPLNLAGTVTVNANNIALGSSTSATATSQLLAMTVTIVAPLTYRSTGEWSGCSCHCVSGCESCRSCGLVDCVTSQ